MPVSQKAFTLRAKRDQVKRNFMVYEIEERLRAQAEALGNFKLKERFKV
jgi:hypothetical protein